MICPLWFGNINNTDEGKGKPIRFNWHDDIIHDALVKCMHLQDIANLPSPQKKSRYKKMF